MLLHAAYIEKGGGRRATYPPPLPRPTPAYGRGRAGRPQPSGAPAAQRAIRATQLGEFAATRGHQCPARFAERTLRNIRLGLPGSFRLDVGGPEHLAPLLRFVGDELAEIGGRARKHRTAFFSETPP